PHRTELLHAAEDVVPTAGVQPDRALAQLVENLLHLEGGKDRLDQDRRPDRARREAELGLGQLERVVPETRLEVALELRKVEVRARPAVELLPGVVEDGQAEVEEARRDGVAVHMQVALDQVPAARPHEQRGYLVVEAIGL